MKSIRTPIPVQAAPKENNTTAFSEDINDKHHPINNSPVEDVPSLPDHMRYMKYELRSYQSISVIFENVSCLSVELTRP